MTAPPHRAGYPSDLTDAEWKIMQPLLPPPTENPDNLALTYGKC